MKSHLLAVLALAAICLFGYSAGLAFDTNPNQIKCFRDTFSRHQVISGEVGTTSSPFQQLKFWVRMRIPESAIGALPLSFLPSLLSLLSYGLQMMSNA